ncbi:alcohol dehydrogenase [Sphingomonas sp. Leaf412]|uniref:Zn-dependent alcohol dehydrogenase n=1 Tax=Sphingomonas sp. Leaf412 TaxID=1736370 RepID=UPI000701F163|nr:Zn-dependent alcohol dehydrogenase [Sphingomonas sp. Leaf412]KQT35320.1 alcohol dehydrogenase [Sphingomonas sp. Leaf412]
MRAAVLYQSGEPLVIDTLSVDKPGPHEVLIRVAATGVCHSDLHMADGSFPAPVPAVLGHETAGVVEAVGEHVRTVKVGDHVVTCVSGFCGHCQDCITGHLSICQVKGVDRPRGSTPRMTTPAGKKVHQVGGLAGFAEQMLVHEKSCVAIRPDMPLDLASVIGCAVTTGYGAVVNTAAIKPGSTVAVIGCGGVGLMIVNAALIAGAARIIAIDRVPAKLAMARDMGATDVVEATGDVVAEVVEMTKGGVHYSFEAIGLKPTVEQAFRMLRPGGTCTVVGVAPVGTSFDIGAMDLLLERRLQGSFMGSNHFPIDMPRLVDLYMQGRLKLDALVSRRIALEQVNEAFAELKTGQLARSVITF